MHVLEAGFESKDRPCVVLLHGFPELAYSWRKVMLPIASAGFHVIAPDRRAYGRTSGWDVGYDDDIGPFNTLNQVKDILALVSAFRRNDELTISRPTGVAFQYFRDAASGRRSGRAR